jgi:hypothetical protein
MDDDDSFASSILSTDSDEFTKKRGSGFADEGREPWDARDFVPSRPFLTDKLSHEKLGVRDSLYSCRPYQQTPPPTFEMSIQYIHACFSTRTNPAMYFDEEEVKPRKKIQREYREYLECLGASAHVAHIYIYVPMALRVNMADAHVGMGERACFTSVMSSREHARMRNDMY